MIALTAAAIKREGLAAVVPTKLSEPLRDFTQGSIPVDRFEATVRTASQWRRQTIRMVLIKIETLRLLTEIAMRARVRLVTAYAHDLAPRSHDLDPAVYIAENTGGRVPAVRVLLSLHV